MLKVRIVTLTGTIEDVSVSQIEFLQVCHYSRCRQEFLTMNIDERYCKPSHRQYAWRERHFGTMEAARSSTIGCAFL